MAFNVSGPSIALSVTDAGQTTPIQRYADQVRVYNEGPNACRVAIGFGTQTVADTNIIIPAGLVETLTKIGADTLTAKCKTGETATLNIICGSGD